MQKLIIFTITILINTISFAQQKQIHLWPDNVPGEDSAKNPPRIYPDTSRAVIRITDINDPLITMYPAKGKGTTNPAMIVCAGGGNKYLAINIEGEEIAAWLNQQGITAFVLQYRVPLKQKGALQDIQRAVRVIRANAVAWHVDPKKVGAMGFSAGGNLSARAATAFNKVAYDPVDVIDSNSCRPDFALLIYPGSLATGPEHKLIPELIPEKNTPPIFMFVANDDGVGLPLSFASALHDAKLPMELHVVPKGGHGYGLRKGNPAAEAWPELAIKWLKTIVDF